MNVHDMRERERAFDRDEENTFRDNVIIPRWEECRREWTLEQWEEVRKRLMSEE